MIIGNQIFQEFNKDGITQWFSVALLALGALFNIVLCRVWFLINRRTREWLDVRIKRAKQIEQEPDIEFKIFALQDEEFKSLNIKHRGASKLEKHIPTIFSIPWIFFIVCSIALQWI